MSLNGLLSVKLLPQSLNKELFQEYVKEERIPKLWKGATVVMDNLQAHKVKGVKEMLEEVGAKIVYLPRF